MLLFYCKAISLNASVLWAQNCFSPCKRKQTYKKKTKPKTQITKGRSHHRHRNLWDCAMSCGVAILVRYACPTTADLSSTFLPNKWKSPGSCHGKGDAPQRLHCLLGEVSQPLALVCHWADPPLIRSLLLNGVTPAASQQSPSTRLNCLQDTLLVRGCYWNMYGIQAWLLGSSRQKSGIGAERKISTGLVQARQKSHSALKPQFQSQGIQTFSKAKTRVARNSTSSSPALGVKK